VTLLLSGIALVLAGGLSAPLAGRRSRAATALALAGMLPGSVLGLLAAGSALATGGDTTLRVPSTLPFGDLCLRLDAVSAFFLLVLFAIAPLAAVYGAGYLADTGRHRRLGGAWCFTALLVAGMAVTLIAADAVLFLIAWEVMSLAAYFLVTFDDERADVREAGWTYLIATHVGTAFLIVFFTLAARPAGSLELAAMAAAPAAGTVRTAAFLAALLGLGIKAGLFPLHVWLPEAHPAAPSHVSALMSGVMLKMGVYGLLRALAVLGDPPAWWGWLLVGAGAASAVLGVLFALAQSDVKRLLAFSSVENVGIITLGIGLSVVGVASGSAGMAFFGLAGALFHVLNHALFKSLLFLGAGAVVHAAGTRDLDRLGGLLRRMRVTGTTFLVGAAAISGLPPANGFAGELLLYLGAFGHATGAGPALAVPALTAVIALALAGGLASVCFTKAFGAAFLGESRSDEAAHAHEPGAAMVAPMVVLAAGCAAVALAAPQVLAVVVRPAHALAVTLGAPPLDAPHAVAARALGAVQLAAVGVALLVAALALLRLRLLRGREVREAPTWDCGYGAPAPRMQYTASSFAQPLVDLFEPVLRTRRRLQAPAGLFPRGGSFASDTPDAVLEVGLKPLFRRAGAGLAGWRFLQQGRVQVYVLYIAVTLIALLVWKAVER
jgi:formate hydrogenlyase subunit 3/multisubunit Na+/H+ antiporter MnhD subunit